MESFTSKVDNQGRILIPARLRKEAGIEPDSEVLVFCEDGGIVVLTRDRALAQARRMVDEALGGFKGSLVGELLAGRRREAEKEKHHGRYRKSA